MKDLSKLISFFLLFIAFLPGNAVAFERNHNEITIRVNNPDQDGPRKIRLKVINSKIIRVEATAETEFPAKTSLMIVPQEDFNDFSITEKKDLVELITQNVKATVSKLNGRIRFYDRQGKEFLSEIKSGGKKLTPFVVPSREIGVDSSLVDSCHRKGWTWNIRFDSPNDEAFYGLGQHQSGELNMKGRNEDLFQYNTKVSVPFVISNKNYGLLWDSNSYCRWGNPRDYLQLNKAFKLYDKYGKPGHLTGNYIDRNGNRLERNEDSLYYEYNLPKGSQLAMKEDKGGIQNLPANFNLKGSQVTYEGYLEAPESDVYHFILYYAGYIKVFIDGKETVAERWRTAWNPNSWKFDCKLDKGIKTSIRIEWKPDGDVSYCGLRVASPQTKQEEGQLSIWSEMSPDLDYYFIAGADADEVISGYRQLTGKAQVLPKWALGLWQSRERYKTSDEIVNTLKEFRSRHIPIDNIVQDWNYWKLDRWGDHTFDTSRYPNPQGMMDSVHVLHGRFMISVWPKFYETVANYQELDKNGWIYHQAIADDIHDWLGFRGSFYDAYSADARKKFWRQMDENLYSKYKFGIDAWWMDASEPNVLDCTPMWYRKTLCGPTALGTSTEFFNAYSLVNADAIYNGQRLQNPDQRVFLLTRSGFAGEQRYSTATWSGDIATRWEDMRAQMSAGLNYCMAGLPFWGMDIGGFCVEDRFVAAQQEFDQTGVESEDLKEWRELQVRWNAFGCFVPIYRTHGQWPFREPWNIAPRNHPAYRALLYYDKLRYRLMPYLYSIAGWVHFNDYTMMRGLTMDFNGDPKIKAIADQWMFGPSLMACPVCYYGQRQRNVYFPKQRNWFDLYTGKYIEGGQSLMVSAPYDKIPVYVPEGSIIPFGPEIEWSDEKLPDTIQLFVYVGRDAHFKLYEDEETNYNYEKGLFSTIDFDYDENSKVLTIQDRQGAYPSMLSKRFFYLVKVSKVQPKALQFDLSSGIMVAYDGKELKVKL